VNDIERVLSFWLEPKPRTEAEVAVRSRYWFYGGEEVDRDVRARFAPLVERARRGELDAWAESPRGALALIILLDQFSRNLYRGTPEAFSADDKALALARAGFDSGRFAAFDPIERMFAAMPFLHAEDLASQVRAVELAVRDTVGAEPVLKQLLVDCVDFGRKHLDVIARFGRFPHRNAALSRTSTPAEQEYLDYLKYAGQWL
jgi:uncharacterized protein (DUF924 family)